MHNFKNGKFVTKIYVLAICMAMALFLLPAVEKAAAEEPAIAPVLLVNLPDIDGHWATTSIDQLVNLGAITGYPDNTFRPDNPITRAEFATVLVKALNLQQTNGKVFNDTVDHWASSYISTAAAHGIVTGHDEFTFAPDSLITREQIVAMVVRAKSLPTVDVVNEFTDSGDISPWAESIVATAAVNGIIGGYPDSSFKPLSNATRAESATMIIRALDVADAIPNPGPGVEVEADEEANATDDAGTDDEANATDDAGTDEDANANDDAGTDNGTDANDESGV